MTKEQLSETYGEAYRYLSGKEIHELRGIGRAFQLKSPSSCKKQELILRIIGVGAGIVPVEIPTLRGAPRKGKEIDAEEVDKIRKLLKDRSDTNAFVPIDDSSTKENEFLSDMILFLKNEKSAEFTNVEGKLHIAFPNGKKYCLTVKEET